MPRNSEKVARVTIRGGRWRREIGEYGGGEREMPIAPSGSQNHGCQAHHRADGEVDASGDEDRRHR
jgi:hypothetical protein